MPDISRILVPIDFSTTSREALDWAMKLARRFEAGVTVLHVQDMPDMSPLAPSLDTLVPSYGVLKDVIKARFELSQETMEAWLAPFEGEEVALEPLFRQGPPFDVILEVCKEGGYDLLVMGTHGRTGLGRLLLGSTTERVVRLSPIPVLTVQAPQKEG